VGKPDPLIVGPPDQVYEQSERSRSRRQNGFATNPNSRYAGAVARQEITTRDDIDERGDIDE
jgi:hypothetical protein